MKITSLIGALVLSLPAVAVHAGSQGSAQVSPKPAASFGYLDTDKDARLSRQEAKVDWAVAQRFAAADRNHDGYLDEEEFKQLSRG
jgi:hypothetical protein